MRTIKKKIQPVDLSCLAAMNSLLKTSVVDLKTITSGLISKFDQAEKQPDSSEQNHHERLPA